MLIEAICKSITPSRALICISSGETNLACDEATRGHLWLRNRKRLPIYYRTPVRHLARRASRLATLLATAATMFLAVPDFAAWGGNTQPVGNLHLSAKAKKKSKVPMPLESLNCPANFITAMVPDGQGGVWVGSEDSGVYHGRLAFRPGKLGEPVGLSHRPGVQPSLQTTWKHFGKTNSRGLASNFITALCMDGRGRLWAGTNRHGVCVFNGKKWRHYGIVHGPLGSHVNAIALDKPANQIWIATEDGLSIYQCVATVKGSAARPRNRSASSRPIPRYAAHTWHYLTTAGGSARQFNQLPPNPDAIAFDSRGRVFVGTQCGGLAIGMPRATAYVNLKSFLSYKSDREIKYTWRIIQGPWHLPIRPFGSGLPGNLINAVRIIGRNRVLVATDWGLAVSENDGISFRYQRGQDYAAKVLGLWHPPHYFQMPSKQFLAKLLPGDHMTALAQDAAGNIWIGTWRNGFEVLNPRTRRSYRFAGNPANPKNGGYVCAFCPITTVAGRVPPAAANTNGVHHQRAGDNPDSHRDPHHNALQQIMLISYYGSGVWAFDRPIKSRQLVRASASPIKPSSNRASRFPRPAAAPTAKQITSLLPELSTAAAFAHARHFPYATFLRDDWTTEGDWAGRNGRRFAVLCSAAYGGLDYDLNHGLGTAAVSGIIGPHHASGDTLREWEQWKDTDNPRSLYIPQLGYRRETTWDDHGETYPVSYQGPDVWVRVHLKKAGLWRVSLYFFNKDGHAGANRQRDYPVAVYSAARAFAHAASVPLLTARTFPTNRQAMAWARWAMRTRPLAQGRVVNFWGGVYLRFLLAGPGQYMIRLDRNASLDTILQAVLVDSADAPPTPFAGRPMVYMGGVQYRPPAMPTGSGGELQPAISVWHAAQHAFGTRGGARRRLARILCYRYAFTHHAPPELLSNWRWHLDIWAPQDRRVFDRTMNQAFRSLLKGWKGLKSVMQQDGDLQSNSGEMGHE